MVSKVLMKESSRPTDADLHFRSDDGTYTQQEPLWAEVSNARYQFALLHWAPSVALNIRWMENMVFNMTLAVDLALD